MVNALLTRLLSPEHVGAYYLIFGLVSFALLVCLFGTQQGVVRLISAAQAGAGSISTRAAIKSCLLIVSICTGLVAGGYAAGLGAYIGLEVLESEYVASLALITALWIVLRAGQTFFAECFRGFKRIDFASTFEGTASGLLLMVFLSVVFVLQLDISLEKVLLLTVISLVVAVSISGYCLVRIITRDSSPGGHMRPRYALSICAPLFVASLCLQGFTELHIGILGYFASGDELALYGAAFRLSKFVVLPLVVVNSIIPPMVSQLYHLSKSEETERLLRLTATVSSIPTLLIVATIVVFGEEILALVFGDFYRNAAMVLTILLCGQLVNSMSGSPGILLAMANRQKVVMISALLSGALGLVLSVALAPAFAATGVAIGVAVSTALHNIIMWAYCRVQLNIRTHLNPTDARKALGLALNPRKLKELSSGSDK